MVEQAAREKTEKIINAELQKAAANPDLQVRFFFSASAVLIPNNYSLAPQEGARVLAESV